MNRAGIVPSGTVPMEETTENGTDLPVCTVCTAGGVHAFAGSVTNRSRLMIRISRGARLPGCASQICMAVLDGRLVGLA